MPDTDEDIDIEAVSDVEGNASPAQQHPHPQPCPASAALSSSSVPRADDSTRVPSAQQSPQQPREPEDKLQSPRQQPDSPGLLSLIEREQALLSQIANVRREIALLESRITRMPPSLSAAEASTASDQDLDDARDIYIDDDEAQSLHSSGNVRTPPISDEYAHIPSAPKMSVPINADVLSFDFKALYSTTQFDVILMDPPWQLAPHAPSRGVAISYSQLSDAHIESLPISSLQANGFIFLWVINTKYVRAFELLDAWGYTYCDDVTWVKRTVHRRLAKGHGYYLQHAKETCLVAYKGNVDRWWSRKENGGICSDVIFSERRGQSQKPTELYDMIEKLVPHGRYLEIFGRRNNLRDYWVTIGNEL